MRVGPEREANVCGNVGLPETRSEDEGWGKGEVSEVNGRVEETSSSEQEDAGRVRGWFALLRRCDLVVLNMEWSLNCRMIVNVYGCCTGFRVIVMLLLEVR